MEITYLNGDATAPPKPDPCQLNFVVHICNNKGAWGAGFVLALSARWPRAEEVYRKHTELNLGYNQIVWVEDRTYVINMIAQNGFACKENNFTPLDYNALQTCLMHLSQTIRGLHSKVHVHMPRIGCGLGGGCWGKVGPMVETILRPFCASVNVYDYSPPPTVKPNASA